MCDNWEKTSKQILKNQQDAEKWKDLEHNTKMLKNDIKLFTDQNDINREIVERLKKLLEGQTDTFTFTGRYLRKEVLGEEK